MTQRKQIDAAQWFWHGFHRRGWLSHRHRYKHLKHLPMPASGDEQAWLDCRVVQARVCLSPEYLVATLSVTSDHLDAIMNADHEDGQWWRTHAPTGCVSPLGTFAAAEAFTALQADYQAKGFYRGVTLPSLMATAREAALGGLAFAFGWLLPLAYPLRCLLLGVPIDILPLILLAGASGISAAFAEKEYQRQL